MKEIKDCISPCGLSCEKCFANKDGNIQYHAQKLKEYLGNFDIYAERFTNLLNEPIFENYPQFKSMLNHFANAQCDGCRKSECKLFDACKVRDCSKQKNVEYCYVCDEFPCKNTGFDLHLEKRWININETIKKIGLETYYNNNKHKSRY